MGFFDFDELDSLEHSPRQHVDDEKAASTTDDPVWRISDRPSTCSDQTLKGREQGYNGLSKARAWFEIRRAFDAEPQKFFQSSEKDEWKQYYAKELILKATLDKLKTDGFVVVDAMLAPEYFKRLVGQLAQVAILDTAAGHECGTTLAVSEDQQRALCESCVVSFDHNNEHCMLQPQTGDQFFKFFKAFLHEVAGNSVSDVRVLSVEKLRVQFVFGDWRVPRMSALSRENAAPRMDALCS